MRAFHFSLIVAFLFFSCGETKQGDLLEIAVDTDQNALLLLSEIAEELAAIELELTDESVVNIDQIERVIISKEYFIIAELSKILIFNKYGKFIRSIASKGLGPGEYNYIHNIAMDEKNKRLFILANSPSKIMCYDFDGNFLKSKAHPPMIFFEDISYINDQLLVIGRQNGRDEVKGLISHSAVCQLNNEFEIIDSYTINNIYLGKPHTFMTVFANRDFIFYGNKCVYIYYGNYYFTLGDDNSREKVLFDTLYRFKDNHLVPELTLKFNNDKISKFISPYIIYRSSRYIFAKYRNNHNMNDYFFCYDTKTGKGYNTQDGYKDDINQIEKWINIRPSTSDTETFYYLHTHMKPDDLEEPNPTLYIGKLKK